MLNSTVKLLLVLAVSAWLYGCAVPTPKQQEPKQQPAEVTDLNQADSRPSFLPDAPVGYEWQPVDALSDEFDTPYLNTAKWRYVATDDNAIAFIADGVINLGGRSNLNAIRTSEAATSGYTEWRLRSILPSFEGQIALLPDVKEVAGCLSGIQLNMDSGSITGSLQRFPSAVCNRLAIPTRSAAWSDERKSRSRFATIGIWRQAANELRIYVDGQPVILESDASLGSDMAMLVAIQGDLQIDHMRHFVLQQSPQNLLRSADFEADIAPRHWRFSSENAFITQDADNTYTNGNALHVGPNSRVLQAVVIPEKGTYTLHGFAKRVSGNAGAVVSIVNASGDILGEARVVSSNYSPLSVTFKTQQRQPVSLVISNTDNQSVSVLDTLSLTAR